jgi:Rieske Fe-S protein
MSGGQYDAIGNTCTHRGGPLCEGEISGSTVTCPRHGAESDISTGSNLAPPAPSPVPCYKVRVVGEASRSKPEHRLAASPGPQAGDTIYCQWMGRDPGFPAPDNYSLSSALAFTLLP